MNILFIDTETTGLDKSTDEIIELAIVEYNTITTSTKNIYHHFFNPSVPITEESEKIHGYSKKFLSDYCKFSTEAKLIQAIVSNKVIGGHNISFDIEFLNRQLVESNETGIPINVETIDTLLIEKLVNSHKLSETYKRYFNKELLGAHGAITDVNASISIFESQIINNKLEISNCTSNNVRNELGIKIVDWLDYGHCFYLENEVIKFGFGKNKGLEAKSNHSYLKWMLNNSFGFDTKNICNKILMET